MPKHLARGSYFDDEVGSPYAPRDACGVGFIARQSGERTHEVVSLALEAAARLAHRGASATDHSADGAGLLAQIPRRLFILAASRLGIHLPADASIGVGMCFLPTEVQACEEAMGLVTDVLLGDGIPVLGWREVPIRPEVLANATLAPEGYKMLVEILVRGKWEVLVDVPYRFETRTDGQTKSTLVEGWNMVKHLVRLWWSTRVGWGPEPAQPRTDGLEILDPAAP